jgi:hypothetical protein
MSRRLVRRSVRNLERIVRTLSALRAPRNARFERFFTSPLDEQRVDFVHHDRQQARNNACGNADPEKQRGGRIEVHQRLLNSSGLPVRRSLVKLE